MSVQYKLNKELAQMLKGGVIMDVTNPEQAKIAEEADFMLMRNADKATLLNTELIPLSATKNAGGVQVFTLKKNSAVTAVFAKAEFETEEYEYYRTKKIPTTGHFIQEKDKTTNHLPGQMALGE